MPTKLEFSADDLPDDRKLKVVVTDLLDKLQQHITQKGKQSLEESEALLEGLEKTRNLLNQHIKEMKDEGYSEDEKAFSKEIEEVFLESLKDTILDLSESDRSNKDLVLKTAFANFCSRYMET